MTALVALTLCAGALTGVSHDEPKDTPHQSSLRRGCRSRKSAATGSSAAPINFGRPEDVGTSPVGMYFLCFQADLGLQFEFIQGTWANTVGFLQPSTGVDPIIGQGNNLPQGREWPKAWGDPSAGSTRVQVSDFVTLKGGEYFFAPSVGFLKNIEAGACRQRLGDSR